MGEPVNGTASDLDPEPLRHAVALVTGASRGIGFAIARALARAGAALAVVARTRSELESARQALAAEGHPVIAIPGDVAERGFCFSAVAQTERELGPIGLLANVAGIQGPIGPIEELPEPEWTYTVQVDLLGTVWMIQAVLPGMKQRHRGVIVNLSGGGATGPRERFSAYGAAKAAVVRLTESVAVEVAPFGVRVHAISPGAVNTRMLDEIERAGERAGARAMAEVRSQRASGGTPPDLAAELVLFLASDAAQAVTGRLMSAVWDDWRGLQRGEFSVSDPDWYTLRRIKPDDDHR